jgi:RNA polymerase sigma-70 factor (ECF subfamily)
MALSRAELQEKTDEELMSLVQENNELAFSELVERYQQPLATFIARYLGSGPHVQDVLQDTFIRVWRHRARYKSVAKFSTWIYTIAGNLAKTEIRRLKIRRTTPIRTGGESIEDESVDVVDESAKTEQLAERDEIRTVVLREIERLPEVYKVAVILRDLQDNSYEEISDILQVPVGTVKPRVNRGRAKLQKRLKSLRG